MAERFDDLLDSIDACCADSAEYAAELKELLRAQTERVVELEDAIDAVVSIVMDPDKPMPDEMLAAILNLALVQIGAEPNPDAFPHEDGNPTGGRDG